jgi:hypothetical protein
MQHCARRPLQRIAKKQVVVDEAVREARRKLPGIPAARLAFYSSGTRINIGDFMEARVRIELTHKGFADLSLTTWVPRLNLLLYRTLARFQRRSPWIVFESDQ